MIMNGHIINYGMQEIMSDYSYTANGLWPWRPPLVVLPQAVPVSVGIVETQGNTVGAVANRGTTLGAIKR